MELTLGEHKYRIGHIGLFGQLHIARRLLPCLGKLSESSATGPGHNFALAATAVAALSDEDMRSVINACLKEVERKLPGGGWAPMLGKEDILMYEISLPDMLRLTCQVISENMRDVLTVAPCASA